MNGRLELTVRPGISFVHDPSPGTGKTRDMAKGVFLCCTGRLCAGSSAGFGLPVLKMPGCTCFPSLASASFLGSEGMVKKFTLDRTLAWTIHGRSAPSWFGPAMELLVEAFMGLPGFQHAFLRTRALVLSLLSMKSSMVLSSPHGRCSVTYVPVCDGLKITVQASDINGGESLIIMNEVDGRTFNRIRSGSEILVDHMIRPWFSIPLESVLEARDIDVGISIIPEFNDSPPALFCGREVSADLDWAGFALPCKSPVLSYRVLIRSGLRGWPLPLA